MRRVLAAAALLWAAYLTFAMLDYFMGGARFRRHHVESAWLVMTVVSTVALSTTALACRVGRASQPRAVAVPIRTSERPSALAMLAAATLAAFAIYVRALGAGLFSDDFILLRRVQLGSFFSAETEFIRPLPLALWWLVIRLTGDAAVWLHAVNVALHGVNGGLVWRLARRLGASGWWAASATAFFLFFPGNVEAIVWPSGVQDVLMTTMGLGVLLTIACPSVSWARGLAGIALLVCAVLSKETAVAFPILGLLVLACSGEINGAGDSHKRRSTMSGWMWCIASLLLAGAYVAWRAAAAPDVVGNIPQLSRLALKNFIVRPFAGLGAPWTTADLAHWPVLAALGSCVPLAIIAGIVWTFAWRGASITAPESDRTGMVDDGRISRLRVFATLAVTLGWPLVAVAPVGRYFFVSADLAGSRYLYLPSVGWALWLALSAQMLAGVSPRRLRVRAGAVVRTLLSALCLAYLAVCVFATVAHIETWRVAAAARDRLLEQTLRVTSAAACSHVSIDPVPDTVQGVYVFRNGLQEAIEAAGIHARLASPSVAGPGCSVTWDAPPGTERRRADD